MRKRSTRHIEFLHAAGFPVVSFDVNQMKDLKTWHSADNPVRQEQLKKEILDGRETTPIILTKDYVVLDGHGRLKAYRELGLPIKALVCPFTLDECQNDFMDILDATSYNRFIANDNDIDDFLDF